MKIIFDLRNVGLGNNGVSFTLIKSGNTLVDMGHEVIFVDSGRNQHTWVPLKADHRIIKQKSKLPVADFIIATGYKSVVETVMAPPHVGRKFHYIRGWETWQYNENDIIKKILKAPTVKLVNGLCLQNKLKSLGFDSHLIRPGYDFDKLKPIKVKKDPNVVVIGGLNKQGRHANNKRTSWVLETVKSLKRKYGKKIQLYMFGMDGLSSTTSVDKYIRNPSIEEKNELYNKVDIWLAPSLLEGLHMPPAEAMITECPVIGTNAEMSGTIDYLEHMNTGIVTNNDIQSFIQGTKELVDNPKLRKKLGKNARLKILEIGNRRSNMEILVDLLEKYKK
jgi:glycosyltransferase involved in cell wall biosynthesis